MKQLPLYDLYCMYTFVMYWNVHRLQKSQNVIVYLLLQNCQKCNSLFAVLIYTSGTFEQSEFRQYLNGPPIEIEVHDRDRKPEAVKLKASLFGDDLEDEKISNVGTVASE